MFIFRIRFFFFSFFCYILCWKEIFWSYAKKSSLVKSFKRWTLTSRLCRLLTFFFLFLFNFVFVGQLKTLNALFQNINTTLWDCQSPESMVKAAWQVKIVRVAYMSLNASVETLLVFWNSWLFVCVCVVIICAIIYIENWPFLCIYFTIFCCIERLAFAVNLMKVKNYTCRNVKTFFDNCNVCYKVRPSNKRNVLKCWCGLWA